MATTSVSKASRRNVRRKALIVGINKYQNPANWLDGCVNDAMDMDRTLKIFGWPAKKGIKLLLDEDASTQGIKDGLDWLVKDVQDGDVLVFYYSGHGSQVADLNNEERDSYDEIICPWDISWRGNKYITDDQLFDYFTNRVPKGVRTDVILDSCFSGSATREVKREEPISNSFGVNMLSPIFPHKKQRYLPPPPDHQSVINSMIPAFTEKNRFGKAMRDMEQVNQNNVLLSMCMENQQSWEVEFNGQVRGAGTYYFTRILRKANGLMTRGEIYTTLRSSLSEDGFEQIPNLEVPNADALNIFPFTKESQIDRPEEIKKR